MYKRQEATPNQERQAEKKAEKVYDREGQVSNYTRENLADANAGTNEPKLVYDTLVRVIPHDGAFRYPDVTRSIKLSALDAGAGQPFLMNTPPFIAVKVNLLYGATLTPNLAGEIGLGRRTTIEVSGGNNRGNLNGSEEDNKKLVHWIVKPEFRYWLCERFNGHFFGAHGFYGKYNVSGHDMPLLFDKEYRYEGRAIGGGISYGYHLVLGRRWGLEFNAGVGVASLKYEKSDCIKCGNVIEEATKTYFGPTAAGIKLVFIIK